MSKDGHSYYSSLEISNVTVEDAGKYRVTAKNELGESNATISLNFDSESLFLLFKKYNVSILIIITQRLFIEYLQKHEHLKYLSCKL